MGNSTVTPAKSRAPVVPITSTYPRTSATVLNPDVPSSHLRSPTSPTSSYSPTFVPPVISPTENTSITPPVPITSPTFAFPVISPTFAVPIISPVPAASDIPLTTTIPIEHPITTRSIESPHTDIPVGSPTDVVPLISHNRVVVVHSPPLRIAAPSPIRAVPANTPISVGPLTSFSPNIPIHSSTPNINISPVISPDTSAVSPTLDFPPTPIGSPIPTDPFFPVKPTIVSKKNHPTARIVHDVSTSPMVKMVPRIPPKSIVSRPNEVSRKPTVSKNLVSPPESTARQAKPNTLPKDIVTPPESTARKAKPNTLPKDLVTPPESTTRQVKPNTLSSAERSNKWSEFEQKYQEKQKRLTYTTQRTQSLTSSTTSLSKTSTTDLKIVPIVPDIVAVPSFSLRSTAVCISSDDPPLLTERTQSIHSNISILKYYLTYNEAKYTIGDHTKATMFKMDTRLKQTPLPVPSLSFLTRNFSDGTHETKDDRSIAPSFDALGLQHGFEAEPIDPPSTGPRLYEKQQQRKLQQSALNANHASDSNDSFQFVSSTIISQADFAAIERTLAQNNHQPLTSILKKPSSQFNAKPIVDNNPSTVSFNVIRGSLGNKASQSISRSEKLIHRKKINP